MDERELDAARRETEAREARAVARRVADAPETRRRARAVVLALDARDRATVRLLLASRDAGVGEDGLVRAQAMARALFEERFEEDVRGVMAHLAAAEAEGRAADTAEEGAA